MVKLLVAFYKYIKNFLNKINKLPLGFAINKSYFQVKLFNLKQNFIVSKNNLIRGSYYSLLFFKLKIPMFF